MFQPDLPTEQELSTEFSREIQLLTDFQKIKPSASFFSRLKADLTKPVSAPIISPYHFWSAGSLNLWFGRLIPAFMFLVLIGLGGGYYSYRSNQPLALNQESDLAATEMESSNIARMVATKPVASDVSNTMMLKTMSGGEEALTEAPVPASDFKTAGENLFGQALADEFVTEEGGDNLDDQNDFSPIF